MARPLSLEPRQVEGRNKPWELYIPPYLSPTGKRQRLYYTTKREAETAADLIGTRKENFGTSLSNLTADQLVEATKAFELLPPGVTLIEAVKAFAQNHREASASVPLAELFEQYITLKARKSPKHVKALGYTKEKFAYLGKSLVSEITGPDLNKKLAKLPPAAKNAELRHLRAVFNLAIKRGYRRPGTNPVGSLDFEDTPTAEVEIFSNPEVTAILTTALAYDPAMVPFFTLGFFCGIRPDGELQKLDWSDVHLAEKQIVIRPSVSKTKRRRFVDISENATSWLTLAFDQGVEPAGLVCPFKRENVRKRRLKVQKLAKIVRWVQQGMRHTYCSAWLAKHEDVNRLVLQSGHDDADTMWKSYHRGMPKLEAESFWAITPPETEAGKVLPFPATAAAK